MSLEAMSSLDFAFYSFCGPDNPTNISIVVTLDGSAGTLEDWRAHIDERLRPLRRWHQRLMTIPLGLGWPSWSEEPTFDIANHVHEVVVQDPSDTALFRLAAELHGQPLDFRHPCWRIIVVTQPHRQALICNVDHAFVDGLGMVEMGAVLFDPVDTLATGDDADTTDANLAPVDALDTDSRQTASFTEILPRQGHEGRASRLGWRSISSVFEERLSVLPDAARAAIRIPEVLTQRESRAGITHFVQAVTGGSISSWGSPFTRAVSRDRAIEVLRFPCALVKEAKTLAGCTYNDVLMAIVAVGARAVFDAHGATYRENLRLAVPVNIRKPEEPPWGNHVSLRIVTIPMASEVSVDFLQEVAARARQAEQENLEAAAFQLVSLAAALPPPAFKVAAKAMARLPSFDVMVSNVNATPISVGLLGRQVTGMTPLMPLPPRSPLCICAMSYDDKIAFSLLSDARGRDIALLFVETMADALDDMEASLGLGSSAKASPNTSPNTSPHRYRAVERRLADTRRPISSAATPEDRTTVGAWQRVTEGSTAHASLRPSARTAGSPGGSRTTRSSRESGTIPPLGARQDRKISKEDR